MSEYPERKHLRLCSYDYSSSGYYFITVCTREKACTLGSVVGADVLIGPHVVLSSLGHLVEQQIYQMPSVVQYVIMPNHIHLILRIAASEHGPMGTSAPTGSLPRLVHYLKSSVTKLWGRPVWQRSYHDHIIRDEHDYLRILDYIDTNPAKWAEDCNYKEE